MLQQRVNDPTGKNASIWVAPLRDIAHSFPFLVSAAFHAMDEDLKKRPDLEAEMCEYAKALSTYIKDCPAPTSPDSAVELMRQCHLLDFSMEVQNLFGKWMTRVMIGHYYDAIRHALHTNEKALGVDTLENTVKALYAK